MKQSTGTSSIPVYISVALSLAAAVLIAALWRAGMLASLQAAFVLSQGAGAAVEPPFSVALLLFSAAGIGAGLALERVGGRRAVTLIAAGLIVFCLMSLFFSGVLRIDILFVPSALAAVLALLLVQARRLWIVDRTLTRDMRRLARRAFAAGISTTTTAAANERLEGGLRLLDTVLPLDEAVIFCLDETGALAPAARLRALAGSSSGGGGGNNGSGSSSSVSNLDATRNSAWREGIDLCRRAIAAGEMLIQTNVDAAGNNYGAPATCVTMPLVCGRSVVGALLLRLRDAFDETDRPLLMTVSTQLARSLQRAESRTRPVFGDATTFFSARAARHRLDSFTLIDGFHHEQSFAAYAIAESSDGHAIAYLDGTIAYLNEPMRSAAHLTPAEESALDLFGLLDRFRTGVFDEPSIAVRRVLQTGDAYERELFYPGLNQTLTLRIALISKPAETAPPDDDDTTPDDNNGGGTAPLQPLCLVVTVRNVTRMKEYEKLKSDMISLMSHELRTPITSINGFAELLIMDETISAEAREFLGIINSESQRLSRMISTFLSVAKLEAADRQEVLKIPLLLDDVVREIIASLQPVAKKRRIRLVEKESPRLPPVAADRGLITQAITNLVDNAIKYSPERTTVTLSTALEADAVRVVVEDRGYGIPHESIDRVWEKFYRVARDGHDKEEESTGLGLSFVREVVEQHCGEVALESEVGRGSKFSFTLPRL